MEVFVTCQLILLQTPSDWLIRYFAVRRRVGKGCLGDDGEEDDVEDDEEEG